MEDKRLLFVSWLEEKRELEVFYMLGNENFIFGFQRVVRLPTPDIKIDQMINHLRRNAVNYAFIFSL